MIPAAFSRWIPSHLLGLFVVLFLSGCNSLSPFTQKLYEDNNWSEADLKKIQFYLSDDVVLRREIGNGSADISDGRIRVVNGKQVAEVVIRKGTPATLYPINVQNGIPEIPAKGLAKTRNNAINRPKNTALPSALKATAMSVIWSLAPTPNTTNAMCCWPATGIATRVPSLMMVGSGR